MSSTSSLFPDVSSPRDQEQDWKKWMLSHRAVWSTHALQEPYIVHFEQSLLDAQEVL